MFRWSKSVVFCKHPLVKVSRKDRERSKFALNRPIGIVAKENDARALRLISEVLKVMTDVGFKAGCCLEAWCFDRLKSSDRSVRMKRAKVSELVRRSGMILSVGGDGTILRMARALLETDSWKRTSIIGVNAGHMGFLNLVNQTEIHRILPEILKPKSPLEFDDRSCLEVVIHRDGKIVRRYHALNDCVLTKGSISRIFECHVELDGELVASYRADGLIVATPTGSTGYSLAAGGAILEPGVAAAQLTPICPQSSSAKPVVISNHHEVVLSLGRHTSDVFLTVDGHSSWRMGTKDRVQIRRSHKMISFIVPRSLGSMHYFQSLRQKLKWGSH